MKLSLNYLFFSLSIFCCNISFGQKLSIKNIVGEYITKDSTYSPDIADARLIIKKKKNGYRLTEHRFHNFTISEGKWVIQNDTIILLTSYGARLPAMKEQKFILIVDKENNVKIGPFIKQ